jgi:hypothetical protein
MFAGYYIEQVPGIVLGVVPLGKETLPPLALYRAGPLVPACPRSD